MPSDNPGSSLLLHRINPTSPSSTTSSSSSLPKIESPLPLSLSVPDAVAMYHAYTVHPNQCCSAVVQQIDAPLPVVWSFVGRFDDPMSYKHFVRSCHLVSSPNGPNSVGSLRRIEVVSGLPAANSTERLEILDDRLHVISFSVVGGDHRLANYRSVTTLHGSEDGKGTVVVESYVVDVPMGNTREETLVFVDTIVRCNLQSLAQISMNLASIS